MGKPARAETLVVVPTYNEAATIGEVVRRLLAATGDAVDLLVVDDGSPDGTAALVRTLDEGAHRIHVIERSGKLGLGSAYLTGFEWARARGYASVVEMDADLSHDPGDVPRLLAALASADAVIGSRYVPGGSIVNWGAARRLLSRAGNLYARLALGLAVRDSTSGFRAYRLAALPAEALAEVRSEGYAFQIELTRAVARAGRRVTEIPIVFTERTHGRSKMTGRIALEALWRVAGWGLADLRRRPRKLP